jgi:rod shape-determining protein MreC
MRVRDFFLFRRYRLLIFIVFLLLFALVLMSLRAKQRKGVEFFDALLMEICSPFQKASTLVIKTVQGTFQQYIFLVNLEKENRALKKRIAEIEEENHRIKEMKLANERLRQLLSFREKNSPSMIGAEVIGQDPSSWFKSITIDRGERDGVKKGMAVISPAGVIGQILKTAPHYATVLLITDYNSAIDSIVERTRAKAIVEGKGEPMPTEIPSSSRRGGSRRCRRDIRIGWKFSKGIDGGGDQKGGQKRTRCVPIC